MKLMNDTLNAIIQLNGKLDARYQPQNAQLDEREPYLYKKGDHIYMYIGIGKGEGQPLRAENADSAFVAESLKTDTVMIDNTGIIVDENLVISSDGIEGSAANTMYLNNFKIKLKGAGSITTESTASITSVGLTEVPILTVTDSNWGDELPKSGTKGQIFFKIASNANT